MPASAVSPPEKLPPMPSHQDDEVLARYTTVSRSALLAVFLGLASSLMLVSPILVLVPLFAIGAAVVALQQIAGSSGQVTGRWLATIGLCLATLFLGWGFSRQWTRQNKVVGDAQQLVEGWLKLVREGQLQKADQLMRLPRERISSEAALADYYKADKEAGQNLNGLFAAEPLKSFLAMGKGGAYRLIGTSSSHRGFTDEVIFEYAYGEELGTASEKNMWVWVSREVDAQSQIAGWRIIRADHLPPPETH
jgi:hypothetical protein